LVKHAHSDTIEIRKDPEGHDEYTVKKKGASGTGYHTDDLSDAKATAKKMAGETVDEEIEIDEDTIMEMVAKMLSDDPAAEEEADSDAMEKAGLEEAEEEGDLYEEITDGLIDALAEKLTVDMGASLSGWAGRSSEDTKHQMELELAKRRSTDMEEELKALKQAQEELVFENKKLKQTLTNYQEVVGSLKENVQDVNLSNARLLYTNRTLGNTSLNERQKQRIVEAISKAGSVEEARTIHETLQSTVASAPKSRPQSLSEAINRPTSIIRASRKEEPKADPFTTRMRKLAGIN
jgi:FtsZ-binding cell division protein ZapB